MSGRNDGGVGQSVGQRGANRVRLPLCARATTRGKARLQLGEGNLAGYALKAHGERGVVAGERRLGGGLGFGLCVGLTEARSA